jgi:asparagine synthase (glutamine-hydrolysing)
VRGLIPEALIDRKKQGFDVPIFDWFAGKLGEQIRKELVEFCDQTDFLDRTKVTELMDQGQGRQAWYLLNFALWWKQYIAR